MKAIMETFAGMEASLRRIAESLGVPPHVVESHLSCLSDRRTLD